MNKINQQKNQQKNDFRAQLHLAAVYSTIFWV